MSSGLRDISLDIPDLIIGILESSIYILVITYYLGPLNLVLYSQFSKYFNINNIAHSNYFEFDSARHTRRFSGREMRLISGENSSFGTTNGRLTHHAMREASTLERDTH